MERQRANRPDLSYEIPKCGVSQAFNFVSLSFLLHTMPFLQSLKDYAKRHRKGLMVTAAIGGGSYLLGRYATEKLRDFQEKAMTERVAKEK